MLVDAGTVEIWLLIKATWSFKGRRTSTHVEVVTRVIAKIFPTSGIEAGIRNVL